MKKTLLPVILCACIALSPIISFGAKNSEEPSTQKSTTIPQNSNTTTDNSTAKQNAAQASDTASSANANKETIQNENKNQSTGETQNQNRETEQENLQNGAANNASEEETEDKEQSQNQIKTQAQSQINEKSQAGQGGTKEEKNQRSQERKSQVALAVQEMQRIAANNQGIGEQVRIVAQNQKDTQDAAEKSLVEAQSRNSIVKFFIGANYGKLKETQAKLDEQNLKIQEMQKLSAQVSNEGDKQALMEQISVMEQIRQETLKEIESEEKGFSLLGWAFKWFYR